MSEAMRWELIDIDILWPVSESLDIAADTAALRNRLTGFERIAYDPTLPPFYYVVLMIS